MASRHAVVFDEAVFPDLSAARAVSEFRSKRLVRLRRKNEGVSSTLGPHPLPTVTGGVGAGGHGNAGVGGQ